VVTGRRVWLADEDLFVRHGFQQVDEAPPRFSLHALRFGEGKLPRLPHDWDERCRAFGSGLTVVTSGQCPYFHRGVARAMQWATEHGLPARVVRFDSADEARARAPTPYGVCGVVKDGKLLSYYYDVKRFRIEDTGQVSSSTSA
jgi:hypothetical protein